MSYPITWKLYEIISDPSEIATIMSTNFDTIADKIGKPVDLETQQLDNDDFIKKSILKRMLTIQVSKP